MNMKKSSNLLFENIINFFFAILVAFICDGGAGWGGCGGSSAAVELASGGGCGWDRDRDGGGIEMEMEGIEIKCPHEFKKCP